MRPARSADLPELVRMGQRFHEASGLGQWYGFEPALFCEVLAELIDRDDVVILIEPGQGMAGAFCYPVWFCPSIMTAQELFWWVEPEARGGDLATRLLDGLERWALEKGAVAFEMGAMEGLRPEALTRLYRRKGYEPKERLFIKRLS